MKLNFASLFEIVFPLSDDERCIQASTVESFAHYLQPTRIRNTHILSSFKEPHIRAAIHLVKFHNHPQAAALLGSLLKKWLCTLPVKDYVLIPVPLSMHRYRKRGHNQVETIARKAIQTLPHVTIHTHVLKRSRNTPPQTTLEKKQRHKNIAGAFTVSGKMRDIEGKTVILLDDVYTTGTTLTEAKKTLRTAVKPVMSVALAH